MRITVNNQPVDLSEEYLTLKEFLEIRGVKTERTAVALNNKIVKRDKWPLVNISDGDTIMLISAAFGG